MLASLAGSRIAGSLVPVQAAAANTTQARPTTTCGGMAHGLAVASGVSLRILGTTAPLIRSSPASAGGLLRPFLASFFGVALPNNPWIACSTCSRTSFWTTLTKLVGRGIGILPLDLEPYFTICRRLSSFAARPRIATGWASHLAKITQGRHTER